MRKIDVFLSALLSVTAVGCWRVASSPGEDTSGSGDNVDAGVDTLYEPAHVDDVNSTSRDPSCTKGGLEGDAFIESSDDVKRYSGYTSVHDLEIQSNDADLIGLHCLEHVKGDLSIVEYERETLEGLHNLRFVDGHVTITHSEGLKQLVLPSLVSIFGTLTIRDHESLEKVSMPRVETIGAGIGDEMMLPEEEEDSILIMDNHALTDVDFSGLKHAPFDIYLWDLFHAENIDFTSLKETRMLSLTDVDIDNLDGFSVLERVDELDIVLSKIERIDLPTLVQVGRLELASNSALEVVSLPASLAIGTLYVHDNSDLEEVEILSSSIKSIEVEDNEQLEGLYAGSLIRATTIRVEQNDQL